MENKKNKKSVISVFNELSVFMGDKKILMPIALTCSGLSAILNIFPLYFIYKIARIVISGSTKVDTALVFRYAMYAAISAVLGIVVYFIALLTSHMAAFEVEINMKKQGFKCAMDMPLSYYNKNLSGKLRRLINDGSATTHGFLAHQLPDLAGTIISPIIILIIMFLFDWRMGIASIIPMIAGFMLMGMMMSEQGQKFQNEYYEALNEMSSESVEYVRGIPVVKTFGQSVYAFHRFYDSIIRYRDMVYTYTKLWTNVMSLYSSVIGGAAYFIVPVAVLIIGRTDNIALILSDYVMYLLIAPSFGTLIMKSMYFMQNLEIARQAIERYNEVLDYQQMDFSGDINSFDNLNNGAIEFKNVVFQYEGSSTPIINDISFKIEKGKTLALVGASGGGKTTIARLLARFWDVNSGEILIGGVDIKRFSKKTLMENIAFVFQNDKLFKTTLRENILFGNEDATNKQVQDAIFNSRSKEIIDGLEHGLDTVFGSKGIYLSGGERQRITLCRAFLKDAPIVVLDEATAFADPENEHLIQAALKDLSKDKTTLMIAHRLNTVKEADSIAVIDNGKIAEYGNHDELIAINGIYKRMWDEYKQSISWKIGGEITEDKLSTSTKMVGGA